ncbi:MAG: hypothetical protein ACYTGZ_13870, partial [Planctomycetota bacterium]
GAVRTLHAHADEAMVRVALGPANDLAVVEDDLDDNGRTLAVNFDARALLAVLVRLVVVRFAVLVALFVLVVAFFLTVAFLLVLAFFFAVSLFLGVVLFLGVFLFRARPLR